MAELTTIAEPVTETLYELKLAIDALSLAVPGPDGGPPMPVEVRIGFPRGADFVTPSITLEPGSESWSTFEPDHIVIDDHPEDPGLCLVTYRTAVVTIPIQLDLWTTAITDRYRLTRPLRELFAPRIGGDGVTRGEGLRLTLSAQFDAVAFVSWPDDARRIDRDDFDKGLYRYTANLTATADELRRITLPRATWTASTNIKELF